MINNNTISIFEYESLAWNNTDKGKKFKNVDKVKVALTRLEQQNAFNPFTYTASGIKARQYVGVISLAGESIQVLPKIFDKKGGTELNIRGLMYLLKLTKKLKIKETDLANLSKHDDLLEVFIFLFANNLLELLHNDFQRNYVNQQDNLNYIKGKINFTQNIRHNLINKAKIYCEYDEFEDNILINQILKATVNKCIKVSKNNFNLLQKCDILLSNVDEVRFNNPIICNQVKFNRLNQSYQYIFELAKLLLFGNSASLDDKNLHTFSIMFDMNKLFEEAIFQVINLHKNELDIKEVKEQKPQFKMFDNAENNFTMKPDIHIVKNDESTMIIDTKYKKIDGVKLKDDNSKFGVSQTDIYQIFAYSKYYKARQCILLYPQYSQVLKEKLNKDNPSFNLAINTLDLKLENNVKYDGYINILKESLKNIIQKVNHE